MRCAGPALDKELGEEQAEPRGIDGLNVGHQRPHHKGFAAMIGVAGEPDTVEIPSSFTMSDAGFRREDVRIGKLDPWIWLPETAAAAGR